MARKQVKVSEETVAEKPVEETLTETNPKPKRRKKLSIDKIVDEAIKKNNLNCFYNLIIFIVNRKIVFLYCFVNNFINT